jgi:hypothetical protein
MYFVVSKDHKSDKAEVNRMPKEYPATFFVKFRGARFFYAYTILQNGG